MKKMLCWRNHQGIGDWIMSMTALKMLNIQYPEIEIHINDMAKGQPLTPLIKKIVEDFDNGVTKFVSFPNLLREKPDGYDYYSDHLLYPRNNQVHFIEGIIQTLNQKTGLDVRYLPDIFGFSDYIGEKLHHPLESDYILMPSMGKRKQQGNKEWGFENFNKLATMLAKQGHKIVQIGTHDDLQLDAAYSFYLGVNLQFWDSLITNSKLVISIPNGIMCYAGVHGHPQVSIYCGGYDFTAHMRSKFPNQHQIVEQNVSPEKVFEVINTYNF